MTAKITAVGGREDAYVSRVRASTHVAGRAYVAKNGYRFDDFEPYLYRTDDFGATWRSISNGLPDEPINVVWEDYRNANLLFVGNDTGVFVSIDGGATWVKMNNNMPNIPVHDLMVHPRDQDLVLGTYARGFYITNIRPLQELTPAVLASDAHLFTIQPVVQRVRWAFGANDYLFGQRYFQTRNPPDGMIINYYLKNATSAATVTITNAQGQQVAQLQGTGNAGFNTVAWNTRMPPAGRRRRRRQSRPRRSIHHRAPRAARRIHGHRERRRSHARAEGDHREDAGLVVERCAHDHPRVAAACSNATGLAPLKRASPIVQPAHVASTPIPLRSARAAHRTPRALLPPNGRSPPRRDLPA